MRIVCDTNVLLSAYLFRSGALAWLRDVVDAQQVCLVFDRHTAAELLRVLAYPKFSLTGTERECVLLRVMSHAEVHAPRITGVRKSTAPSCRDPSDQMFIELAYASQAQALVTGDKDLTALTPLSSVAILTPQQLREILARPAETETVDRSD